MSDNKTDDILTKSTATLEKAAQSREEVVSALDRLVALFTTLVETEIDLASLISRSQQEKDPT